MVIAAAFAFVPNFIFQFALVTYACLFMTCFTFSVRPYEHPRNQWTDMFNELLLHIFLLVQFQQSDAVTNPLIKYEWYGWACIGIIAIQITGNFFYLVFRVFEEVI